MLKIKKYFQQLKNLKQNKLKEEGEIKEISALQAYNQTEEKIGKINEKFNSLKDDEIKKFKKIISGEREKKINNGLKELEIRIDFSGNLKTFWRDEMSEYLKIKPNFFTESMDKFKKDLENYYSDLEYEITVKNEYYFSSATTKYYVDQAKINLKWNFDTKEEKMEEIPIDEEKDVK